jgi:flagellar biogenesis protein FliO
VSKFAILALFIAVGFIVVPIWLENRIVKKAGEGK